VWAPASCHSDTYGNNLRPVQVDTLNAAVFTCTLSLSAASNGAPAGPVSVTTSTVDTGVISTATRYLCPYGPATVAGNYTLAVTRDGVHVKNSPYAIYIVPGDVDGPSSSLVGVNASTSKRVGDVYTFTVLARVRRPARVPVCAAHPLMLMLMRWSTYAGRLWKQPSHRWKCILLHRPAHARGIVQQRCVGGPSTELEWGHRTAD
jgi:hypothetical protein